MKLRHTAMIIASVVVLTACGSNPSKDKALPDYDFERQARVASAEFLEKNGPLTLKYDEKGNWLAITTSATAAMTSTAPESVEEAFKIATMRAKRNLVEFLSNDVKSTKSVKTISKSYLKNIAQVDGVNETNTGSDEDDVNNLQASKESRQKAVTVAQMVRERIDDNAQFILKGVQIIGRNMHGDHVSVTLMVEPKSVRASDQVRRAMSGF